MYIFFRTNASPTLGFGHLMRCRALAHAMKKAGTHCIMIGPALEYRLPNDKEIFDNWIPKTQWSSSQEDANFVIYQATKQTSPCIIVLDDYRVDEDYQKILFNAKMRWLQFDRTADKPIWADWAINASPAASSDDYVKVFQRKESIPLIGPRYAILRPEFSDIQSYVQSRAKNIDQSEELNVLVTFGGGDDQGAILFTLQTLLPTTPATIRFHVISGAQNPRNVEIEKWIQLYGEGRVELHINPDDIASIFLLCDLAVMAGGTTTFEAVACGLPMIIMSIADNQVEQATAWDKYGAAVYLGDYGKVGSEELIYTILKLIDISERKKMSNQGTGMVDGKGAKRLAKMLLVY